MTPQTQGSLEPKASWAYCVPKNPIRWLVLQTGWSKSHGPPRPRDRQAPDSLGHSCTELLGAVAQGAWISRTEGEWLPHASPGSLLQGCSLPAAPASGPSWGILQSRLTHRHFWGWAVSRRMPADWRHVP